jgi:integrase
VGPVEKFTLVYLCALSLLARHFYASWCINRKEDGGLGLPLKVVQHRLGHSTIQMTADVYGHLFPSGDDGAELAAAEKLLLA